MVNPCLKILRYLYKIFLNSLTKQLFPNNTILIKNIWYLSSYFINKTDIPRHQTILITNPNSDQRLIELLPIHFLSVNTWILVNLITINLLWPHVKYRCKMYTCCKIMQFCLDRCQKMLYKVIFGQDFDSRKSYHVV